MILSRGDAGGRGSRGRAAGAGRGSRLFCQDALLERWRAPWAWPVGPPADRSAWIAASAVLAAGLLLFTVRGPRTRLSHDS